MAKFILCLIYSKGHSRKYLWQGSFSVLFIAWFVLEIFMARFILCLIYSQVRSRKYLWQGSFSVLFIAWCVLENIYGKVYSLSYLLPGAF